MDSKYYLSLNKELVAEEKKEKTTIRSAVYYHSCFFLPDLGVYALRKSKSETDLVFIISGTCAIYNNFKTVAGIIDARYFPANLQYLYDHMLVDYMKRNNIFSDALPKTLTGIVNEFIV